MRGRSELFFFLPHELGPDWFPCTKMTRPEIQSMACSTVIAKEFLLEPKIVARLILLCPQGVFYRLGLLKPACESWRLL